MSVRGIFLEAARSLLLRALERELSVYRIPIHEPFSFVVEDITQPLQIRTRDYRRWGRLSDGRVLYCAEGMTACVIEFKSPLVIAPEHRREQDAEGFKRLAEFEHEHCPLARWIDEGRTTMAFAGDVWAVYRRVLGVTDAEAQLVADSAVDPAVGAQHVPSTRESDSSSSSPTPNLAPEAAP